jgi:hypothetical protein
MLSLMVTVRRDSATALGGRTVLFPVLSALPAQGSHEHYENGNKRDPCNPEDGPGPDFRFSE